MVIYKEHLFSHSFNLLTYVLIEWIKLLRRMYESQDLKRVGQTTDGTGL